jgi:hypothetical protein
VTRRAPVTPRLAAVGWPSGAPKRSLMPAPMPTLARSCGPSSAVPSSRALRSPSRAVPVRPWSSRPAWSAKPSRKRRAISRSAGASRPLYNVRRLSRADDNRTTIQAARDRFRRSRGKARAGSTSRRASDRQLCADERYGGSVVFESERLDRVPTTARAGIRTAVVGPRDRRLILDTGRRCRARRASADSGWCLHHPTAALRLLQGLGAGRHTAPRRKS